MMPAISLYARHMAFFPIRILPQDTSLDFLGKRWGAFILSAFLIIASAGLLVTKGLNLGIDFTGGILIDARFDKNPPLSELRTLLQKQQYGDISLQHFGKDKDILIRIGRSEESQEERSELIQAIKTILAENYGDTITYRKVDYVGPKVGKELILDGQLALLLAFGAILLYIWFRFEWQYGVGAVIALVHDAILTLGFFSLLQLEFNLSSIAAILTIIGYSINDSVVIFDRIRENMRKFKKLALPELLNKSINNNLSRTLLTSLTTSIALLALVIVGGDVIKSFSLAALFGVIVGTYSSIYVASPILIYFDPKQNALSQS